LEHYDGKRAIVRSRHCDISPYCQDEPHTVTSRDVYRPPKNASHMLSEYRRAHESATPTTLRDTNPSRRIASIIIINQSNDINAHHETIPINLCLLYQPLRDSTISLLLHFCEHSHYYVGAYSFFPTWFCFCVGLRNYMRVKFLQSKGLTHWASAR
jgi:hypothetical protein